MSVSIFILYCVPFQLQAIERVFFLPTQNILLCPVGGGFGSEEGGERSGPRLPVTSSDRH